MYCVGWSEQRHPIIRLDVGFRSSTNIRDPWQY
jgi:hypothetical protein